MSNVTAPHTSGTSSAQDVRGISEITILPDGRLYVLGLSKAVLALLAGAGLWPDRRPAEVEAESRESTGAREEQPT